MTSGVAGKRRQGGQSASRFECLLENELNEYYKRIADYGPFCGMALQMSPTRGVVVEVGPCFRIHRKLLVEIHLSTLC